MGEHEAKRTPLLKHDTLYKQLKEMNGEKAMLRAVDCRVRTKTVTTWNWRFTNRIMENTTTVHIAAVVKIVMRGYGNLPVTLSVVTMLLSIESASDNSTYKNEQPTDGLLTPGTMSRFSFVMPQ